MIRISKEGLEHIGFSAIAISLVLLAHQQGIGSDALSFGLPITLFVLITMAFLTDWKGDENEHTV